MQGQNGWFIYLAFGVWFIALYIKAYLLLFKAEDNPGIALILSASLMESSMAALVMAPVILVVLPIELEAPMVELIGDNNLQFITIFHWISEINRLLVDHNSKGYTAGGSWWLEAYC